MAKSYINVYQSSPSLITHLFIEDGIFKEEKIKFKPFLGIHAMSSESTSWSDMYGKPVKIKVFDSIPEMKEWKKENSAGLQILGDISPVNQFIALNYRKEIPLQRKGFKIYNFDIEVYCPPGNGFPSPLHAKWPINAVTIHEMISDSYICLSTGNYTPKNNNITYIKCDNEKHLILTLIELFERDKPVIITGWNCEDFDITYIINRTISLFDEETAKRYSREHVIKRHEITENDANKIRTRIFYTLQGHITWDYLQLYKKFQKDPRERYNLGFIAETELGTGKVDYSEVGVSDKTTKKDRLRNMKEKLLSKL